MKPLAATFPDWLPGYLPGFQELLGVLALSDGFFLIPVEVPGPDIARILADWLERRGVPVQTFEPRTDADWEDLATSLLRSQPPTGKGVAMVIGGHAAPAGMRHGLRLINQRRDSLSRHLARPLLWCGPASFLDATWDGAPDFWSVRAVEQRVAPEAGAGDTLESLRSLLRDARTQGDLANEARLAVQLADDLTAASALTEAAVLVEETLARTRDEPPSVWAELAVRHARIHLARDEPARALAEMNELLQRTLPPGVADDALLVVGAAHEKAGAPDLAVKAYEQALSRALESADPVAEIKARIGLGSNGPAAGLSPVQASDALDAALAKARAIGDASLEAESLRALSRLTAALHDETRSKALLTEALDGELAEYSNNETYELAMSLDAARRKRAAQIAAGESTAGVDVEILALRRKLREGGQLRAGDSLGEDRYLLLKPLGRGGFSVVWEALDRRRSERVAVKVLYPQLAGDPVRRERFFRGARVMSQLQDEAVVRVLEPSGEDGGFYYFVMELLTGGDFRRALLDHRLASDRVLPILLTMAGALSRAHAHGFVHRDVKPSNILLDADLAPKLTDFDLVADVASTGGTRTGAMGTFLYAAPEVLSRPQDADARADVYGLGMTAIFGLYGDDLPLSAVRDVDALIGKLDCPAPVKSVLQKAVAWEPNDRYRDAGIFAVALRRALGEGGALEYAPLPLREPAAGPTPTPLSARTADSVQPPEAERIAPPPPAAAAQAGDAPGPRARVAIQKERRSATIADSAPGPTRPLSAASGTGRRIAIALALVAAGVLGARLLGLPDEGRIPLADGGAGSLTASSGTGGTTGTSDASSSPTPGTTSVTAETGGHAGPLTSASASGAPLASVRCPPGSLLVTGEDEESVCVDRSPVSARDYAKCVTAGKCGPIRAFCRPEPYDPAVCIDWFDATSYCRSAGGWLPQPEQWQKSAVSPAFQSNAGLQEWTSDTSLVDTGSGPEALSAFLVGPGRFGAPERARVSATKTTITFRCVKPARGASPG